MKFKEHVLMELKAEIVARNKARRLLVRRRLLTGAAVAGIAAAAAVAVPFLNGSVTPAYAVTKNTDGTITLKINEFRDPAQVEKDLAALGLTADVSYVKPGTRCAPDRGHTDAGPSFSKEELNSKDPEVQKKIREAIEQLAERQGIQDGPWRGADQSAAHQAGADSRHGVHRERGPDLGPGEAQSPVAVQRLPRHRSGQGLQGRRRPILEQDTRPQDEPRGIPAAR